MPKLRSRGLGGSWSTRAKIIAALLLAIAVSAVVMDRVAVSELRSVADGASVDDSARNIAIAIALIAVSFALFLGLAMRRVIFRSLQELDDVIRRRRAGDRSARLRWTRRDELGVIGRNFDAMADERDEHERRLAESGKQLAEAQRVARLGSWEWRRDTNTFVGSAEMLRMLAVSEEPENAEAPFATAVSYVHPDDLERVQTIVRDSAVAGQPFSFEFRLVRRDGEVRHLYARGEPELDANGEPIRIVGTHHDITERKRLEEAKAQLEEQLAHKQRMESVGQLAGGIAHDFNNLLAVIINYASLLGRDLERDHPARADVEEITRAADLAASLTRRLLIFSRRDTPEPRPLEMNRVLAETEKLLQRTIGEHIDLTLDCAPDLPAVLADAGQIELVLINLAVNARDAMPDGGSLTIRTSGVPPANRAPGIEALGDVRVTVTDTGTGMEEEVAARAFDAFFTTKNPGKGVGLGLPTVYRIVEEAGGAVRIRSTVGEGTVVELDLPATDQAPEAADAGPLAESLDGRGETILLVEDEEGVRRVAERILTEHGYEVLTAADGAEALTVLRGRRESLDLLLADVVLPKVSGPEVARELRTNSRGPAVLYMSGYPGEALGRFNPDDETLLRKPFKAEELLRAVRTSLERAGRVG